MEDLAWLLTKLDSVAPNWFNFGLFLGIQNNELEAIKVDNPRNCNACLRETLVRWLRRRSTTTEQLLKALDTAGEKELSHSLKQRFSQCDHRKGYLQ